MTAFTLVTQDDQGTTMSSVYDFSAQTIDGKTRTLTDFKGKVLLAWSFSVAELRLPSRTVGMVLTITMLALAAILCLVRGLGLA